MRISTTQVSSVMLRSKKLEIREKKWKLIEPSDENQNAMKLSQIRRRIELHCMPEGDKPSFWDEIDKIYFFLDSLIHIRILKQEPKYLATEL
jgi:hypothetical protein